MFFLWFLLLEFLLRNLCQGHHPSSSCFSLLHYKLSFPLSPPSPFLSLHSRQFVLLSTKSLAHCRAFDSNIHILLLTLFNFVFLRCKFPILSIIPLFGEYLIFDPCVFLNCCFSVTSCKRQWRFLAQMMFL